MNAPALPAPDAGHLDGPLLEALAAHAAREDEQAFARQHLDVCERCRSELAALESENAAFGEFFAAEEARLAPRLAPSRREAVYRLATVLASGLAAMLALALVWEKIGPGSGNRPSETPALAEEGKTSPQEPDPAPKPVTPPEIAPTPAPQTPNPGQGPVYRGRTAAEWILDVESRENNKSNDSIHALSALGADAVPTVMAYARKCPEVHWSNAIRIFGEMKDPKAIRLIQNGLSDEKWSMRLICARSLRDAAKEDSAVVEALQRLKNDPDKAVVEAVNEILDDLAMKYQEDAEQALKEGNWNKAMDLCREGLAQAPNNPKLLKVSETVRTRMANEQRDLLRVQARKDLESKNWAQAIEACQRGLALAPNDPEFTSLLKLATEALRAAEKKRTSVGESDLPTTDTKR